MRGGREGGEGEREREQGGEGGGREGEATKDHRSALLMIFSAEHGRVASLTAGTGREPKTETERAVVGESAEREESGEKARFSHGSPSAPATDIKHKAAQAGQYPLHQVSVKSHEGCVSMGSV